MFESFSKNFNNILDKLRSRKIINEDDLNTTMREIRLALLEADVSLPIIKEFISNVKEKAIGQQVIKSVSPGQMIVKIVQDELLSLLGDENNSINLNVKPPLVIMMVGLQGSGKTTSAAKLALHLKKKHEKRVLLASLDVYRPAAQEQLETLAKKIDVESLPIIREEKPVNIAKRAMKQASDKYYDVIILDTAGRLQIDSELMLELQDIKQITKPEEVLLVADSLIGQEAVNVAKEFNSQIGITGIILTRIDGDGRGGAALSMKMATNCPIKYIGTGEKVEDFEQFYPERIASRILDVGDIASFVERAQEIVDEEEAKRTENRLSKGQFDLNDLISQFKTLKKLGGIGGILNFLPGANKLKEYLKSSEGHENMIAIQESIILSMTPSERKNPDILTSSRKRRIIQGSGRTIQELNSLLSKFKQMKKMMNKVGNMDKNEMQKMIDSMNNLK